MTATQQVGLAAGERAALASFCQRNAHWSSNGAARVVASGSTLGVFATTSWEVMTFAAVPLTGPVGSDVDSIVSLAALADALAGEGDLDLAGLAQASVPVTSGLTLLDLPPREGWQAPLHAMSGDLAAFVAEGLSQLQRRTAIFGPRDTDLEARRWWAEPAWADLPTGVLFAAYQLGMLPDDASTVAAAACGRWKRLSTARGQVFAYASESPDVPSLPLIFPNGRA